MSFFLLASSPEVFSTFLFVKKRGGFCREAVEKKWVKNAIKKNPQKLHFAVAFLLKKKVAFRIAVFHISCETNLFLYLAL